MSTIKVDNFLTTGGAERFVSAAWCKANTISTVSIASDGNISSVTDVAQGQFGFSFSTSMPSTSYAAMATSTGRATGNHHGTAGNIQESGTYSTARVDMSSAVTGGGGVAGFYIDTNHFNMHVVLG